MAEQPAEERHPLEHPLICVSACTRNIRLYALLKETSDPCIGVSGERIYIKDLDGFGGFLNILYVNAFYVSN